jgi:hypothetical protein
MDVRLLAWAQRTRRVPWPSRGGTVFDVFCSACARRRLVFPSQVLGLVNAPGGIAVRYRCWCGHVDVWTTGAHAAPAPTAQPVAA